MFEDISKCKYNEFIGKNVFLRMIESIGYRFNRCSVGIEQGIHFKPTNEHMSIQELVTHIGNLMKVVLKIFGVEVEGKKEEYSVGEVKKYIENLYLYISEETEEGFSEICKGNKDVFYAINGPMSDAISHIGQINTYKRMANIESSKSSYYKGEAT